MFCFSGVSLAIKSCILAGVLQGLPIISAFQSFRWQKKIAFSLRIHSKTDGFLHSRCGFAVVALKIRIFSALTKGVLLFRRFVGNQSNCILAGVLQGLPIISAFQSFRWQKKSHSRCGSIVKQMGLCILAAVLQWWHSKFAFFLH